MLGPKPGLGTEPLGLAWDWDSGWHPNPTWWASNPNLIEKWTIYYITQRSIKHMTSYDHQPSSKVAKIGCHPGTCKNLRVLRTTLTARIAGDRLHGRRHALRPGLAPSSNPDRCAERNPTVTDDPLEAPSASSQTDPLRGSAPVPKLTKVIGGVQNHEKFQQTRQTHVLGNVSTALALPTEE